MTEYQDYGYSTVNNYLYYGGHTKDDLTEDEIKTFKESDTPETQQLVKSIDQTIADQPSERVYVERIDTQMSADLFQSTGLGEQLKSMDVPSNHEEFYSANGQNVEGLISKELTGQTYTPQYFMSTTTDDTILGKFGDGNDISPYGMSTKMTITGDTSSIKPDDITSMDAGESEVLLPRGITLQLDSVSITPTSREGYIVGTTGEKFMLDVRASIVKPSPLVTNEMVYESTRLAITEFNPNHGWHGYFSSADEASGATDLTKDSAYMKSLGDQFTSGEAFNGKGRGDPVLYQIYDKQGYNALPTVLSGSAFDKAVADSPVGTIYRGVDQPQYVDAFVSGEYHAGFGIDGNGTYSTQNMMGASNYAGGHPDTNLITMTLTPDANIIDLDTIQNESQTLFNGFSADAQNASTPEEKSIALGQMNLVRDQGRDAALMGYDAIRIPQSVGNDTMIVLNRGAVIVKGG